MKLVLASTSPRRREILALLGIAFEVIEPEFEEHVSPHRSIEQEVLDFAIGKARSVAPRHSESIIIGSDTMILLEGVKIGKPKDLQDAAGILSSLSGKTHRICTGVAIIDTSGGPGLTAIEEVSVDMRAYTMQEIDRYLAQEESLDKAGAYSIQGKGRKLIAALRGDYLAAVGLPLRPIADYLQRRGLSFSVDIDQLYREKAFLNWHRFA
ncbi:MAG: Maf family protein [Candidatus Binatia bacterium]